MTDDVPQQRDADPRLFWSWVGESIRPVAGWVLAVAGIVALALGYAGVSREAIVAKQIPFMVSGGMLGMGLLFLGGALIGTQDVRSHGARIARLEQLVGDLHRVLLDESTQDTLEVSLAEPPADNGRAKRSRGRRTETAASRS